MNDLKRKTSNLLNKTPRVIEINTSTIISLVISSIIGFILIILISRGAFPTPFSDEFYFYQIYFDAKRGSLNLAELLKPHFGHIYVLLKLWFWLVVRYGFDWRVSMYIQAIFIVLSIFFILKHIRLNGVGLLVALSVAFALGSARQWENIYWALQLSAASMLLFSILAFYFVSKYIETQKNGYAAFAFIFSLVALISNGGGIVTFFMTTAAILVLSKRKYIKVFCGMVGGVIFVGILIFMLPRKVMENVSLIDIKNVSLYLLAFFSNSLFSFSERGDDIFSILTGAMIAVLTLYVLISSWREKNKNVFPYLLILFSILSCVLIAYARLREGIWQPNAPRYYPFAAMLLVGNILISGSLRGGGKHLVVAFFLLTATSFAQSYFVEWKVSPHRYHYLKHAHFNLCSGGKDGLAFHGDLKHTNNLILKDVFCTDQDVVMAEKKSQPVLREIGPTQTNKGMPFNLRPNGESALWAKTENCESSCVLVFSEAEIPVIVHDGGKLLTAEIPKDLYRSQGEKSVYIKNLKSGKKSQILSFYVH